MDKVIVTAAITGSIHVPSMSLQSAALSPRCSDCFALLATTRGCLCEKRERRGNLRVGAQVH